MLSYFYFKTYLPKKSVKKKIDQSVKFWGKWKKLIICDGMSGYDMIFHLNSGVSDLKYVEWRVLYKICRVACPI